MKRFDKGRFLALLLFFLICGVCIGLLLPDAPAKSGFAQPAAAALSLAAEDEPPVLENLFSVSLPSATPAPSSPPEDNFVLETLSSSAEKTPRRVLIYHTHTYEAYEQQPDAPYAETSRWRTADASFNMVRVGDELTSLLRSLGFEVVHDVTAFEPPVLDSAYARSLEMLESRVKAGERYDLMIDLHRDAYPNGGLSGSNAVPSPAGPLARLMFLVGKGEGQTGQGFAQKPDWQRNLQIAQAVTDAVNAQAEGLCKDVMLKSGRYNQHVQVGCLLIEVGNNRNALSEALASMPYLADAIDAALSEGTLP